MLDNQDRQAEQTLQPAVSERDHIQGDVDAPVTLVEYGDFECPDCGAAYPIVKQVQQRLGKRMRFVYRHYPLPQHPHAEHAAEAAEAAGAQGKFWEMHDYLFEHQRALGDKQLLQGAQQLGLNESRFLSEMEQGIYTSQIEEDVESGDVSGVEGTPTFFINGVFYDDAYDPETLLAALEGAEAS
jgi:protein-disulfide isomerase